MALPRDWRARAVTTTTRAEASHDRSRKKRE